MADTPNASAEPLTDEVRLAIGLAPAAARTALTALFALDARLGALVSPTREHLPVQMRLAWWREALKALDSAAAPAEPILRDLAAHVLPTGVTGAMLSDLPSGWEAVLAVDQDRATAQTAHAEERGARLFAAAGVILSTSDSVVADAGRGWALSDLAARIESPEVRSDVRRIATDHLDRAFAARWPAAVRPLGTLALLAYDQSDAVRGNDRGWRRAYRFVKFRTTGRA